MEPGLAEHLPPDLMQYGVAVVVIVVVLRLVLDFLVTWKTSSGKNNGISRLTPPVSDYCKKCDVRLERLTKQMDNLWDMHNKYNDDGSPKWYTPVTVLNSIHQDLQYQYKCQKDMLQTIKDHGTLDRAAVEVATSRHSLLASSLESGIEKMIELIGLLRDFKK